MLKFQQHKYHKLKNCQCVQLEGPKHLADADADADADAKNLLRHWFFTLGDIGGETLPGRHLPAPFQCVNCFFFI